MHIDAERLSDPDVRSRLDAAEVAVIGCGGLGSNVAAMLLRSGVRTLTLVDFDRVSAENLNRQLFFTDQIGELKTRALADTLLRIDADARLRLIDERVAADNIIEIVGDADIVVEAVDSAEAKALIVDILCAKRPALPLVAASGLAGYGPANLVVTEQLADNLYVVGDLTSDIREGLPLLATRVVAAAAHQAHAVIRLLLGCEVV